MGILGVACVSIEKPRHANYIWAVGNLGMIYHNYMIKEWEMLSMFIVYWSLAIYGIIYSRVKK